MVGLGELFYTGVIERGCGCGTVESQGKGEVMNDGRVEFGFCN
jgi:hypothetical protein